MKQIITLNREMKDDYHYNEAIKTLRTNIQFAEAASGPSC